MAEAEGTLEVREKDKRDQRKETEKGTIKEIGDGDGARL